MNILRQLFKQKSFFEKLCRPAQLYLVLSTIAVLSILLQNILEPNNKLFCLGIHNCKLNYMKWLLFIPQILYVGVWTIILNSLCRTGYNELSWLIALFPFILFFILLGIFVLEDFRNVLSRKRFL